MKKVFFGFICICIFLSFTGCCIHKSQRENGKEIKFTVVKEEMIPKELKTKTINNNYINYFSCKNRTGEYISWSSDKEDYTLINFWASWDKKSITQRDSLAHHIQSLPKKSLRVLNISLDYDKKEWENACKEENSQWIETCDFKAWSNQVIQQNNIKRLPSNILVDKNRKIIATNLFGKELYDKMVQLTSKNKK